MTLKKLNVELQDNGGALGFETPDTFLGDSMIYCDRCAKETGEMHVLFRDDEGGYHAQHICQPYMKSWTLIYSANPYPMEG